MESPATHHDDTWYSEAVSTHRGWLLRWFMTRCGDASTSEDLVQETLLEAWKNRGKFIRSGGEGAWLGAIARHIFLRWQRDVAGRQTTPLNDLAIDTTPSNAPFDDPVWWNEHVELASIAHRAIRRLPIETQTLIQDRYANDASIEEIARSRQLSSAHVAVRLQRARNHLRNVIATDFADEAAAYGYSVDTQAPRQTTLWCPTCGSRRLMMTLPPDRSRLSLQCLTCNPDLGTFLYHWQSPTPTHPLLASVRSAREGLDRTLGFTSWRRLAIDEVTSCPTCHHPIATRLVRRGNDIADTQIELDCIHCGPLHQSATFGGMAIFHPDGLSFWRDHQRVFVRQIMETTLANSPAVSVELMSSTSSVTRTFIFAATGQRLLCID